jgi:hypothetical protein
LSLVKVIDVFVHGSVGDEVKILSFAFIALAATKLNTYTMLLATRKIYE